LELLQQIATAAGVLALLGCSLWWLRSRGGAAFRVRTAAGSTRALQALDRLALSPQHTLHLVRAGERTLLVSASPSGCALLHSWPDHAAKEIAQ
jgi:flagellar biogenesis protein FliO